MKQLNIPWGQWYEQSVRTLEFPDDWDVRICQMEKRKALSLKQIVDKVDHPVGSWPVEKIVEGKKTACIVMDDISRPTPGKILLPIIIKKLVSSGMEYSHIKVLMALGGHRPMTRKEMCIKVGEWVMERVEVLNHFPFASDMAVIPDEDQVVRINRNFTDAEIKIALGCIVPHTLAGYSGGAKAVIPGIGGIETLYSNHTLVYSDKEKNRSFKNSTCNPDNPMRKNMEAIVGKVGLDFIVNVILNDKMQIADVYAGHFIDAHRRACQAASEALKVKLVEKADIVILSAYPKDTEYSQIGTCFAVLGKDKEKCVKDGGSIVAATAASEGAGFHALFGPGMSLFSPHDDNMPPQELKGRDMLIYTDGVSAKDIQQFYKKKLPEIYDNWAAILKKLEKKYKGKRPVVAVYPMGAIQIGVFSGK